MARVTGIGGVFFHARSDNKALAQWYERCLGLSLEEFGGSVLEWQKDQADDKGITVWHVAAPDSEWFAPSKSKFMVNYRIDDMNGMIERLKDNDVPIVDGPESHENGKILWVMDPDGNKVELWEPKLWDDANASL